MNNLQAPEDRVTELKGALDEIDFVEIWQTVQGEGPFVGTPAVFIRLAGCNLQCPLCDTDYTTNRDKMKVEEVVHAVQFMKPAGLVVITGGEPFRQPLGHLLRALIVAGYTPQVETNGTLFQKDLPYGRFHIVCSPKSPVINKQLRSHITALKYVVQAGHTDAGDGLPTSVLGMQCRVARPTGFPITQVYVQPADEDDPIKNKANLDAALESCMKFGYRICLQTHKIMGLR